MTSRVFAALSVLCFFQAIVQAQTVVAPATDTESSPPHIDSKRAPIASYGKLPLSFEANDGQTDPQVRFLSRGQGYSLFLTDSAAVLALSRYSHPGSPAAKTAPSGKPAPLSRTDVIRMELSGAAKGLRVDGAEKLPGAANYFVGPDPTKWKSNIPTYARVVYAGVYPGVDLAYYGNQRQLEYDFIIAPNADPKPVRLHFEGVSHLLVNHNGDLLINAGNGEIAFRKPVVYQIKDGQREPVEGRFNVLANNTVGFALGSYDRSRQLVIDPTLAYSSYLSMTGARGIAVDTLGDAYLTGVSSVDSFPLTPGAYKGPGAGVGTIVVKLNSTGSALIYAAYLGNCVYGTIPTAIAVDAAGNAYITGTCDGGGLPVTANAFQKVDKQLANGSATGFVSKLNPAGSALVYSTYLGGSGVVSSEYPDGDFAQALAIDVSGDAYITGYTSSQDFPVSSSAYLKTMPSSRSSFVTELNPDGSALVYSTFLGGPSIGRESGGVYPFDQASAIAVNSAGEAFVAGSSANTHFPVTTGAFQTTNNSAIFAFNGFVTRLNATGTAPIYSTYLGGNNDDFIQAIAVDAGSNAYVAGNAGSTNFPVTAGAFQENHHGDVSGFITKLNPAGTAEIYSSYLGANNANYPNYSAVNVSALAIDQTGRAFVTGYATSPTFPTTEDAYQRTNKAAAALAPNAFLTEFSPTGNSLKYSTYFGGSGYLLSEPGGDVYLPFADEANAIALDDLGNVYFGGRTYSSDLPVTAGAFDSTNNANPSYSDAFVAKFAFTGETATTLTSDGDPEPEGTNITLTAHVTALTGTAVPGGEVQFFVNGALAETVALDNTGYAYYSSAILPIGANNISVIYQGVANEYSSSSTGLTQTIIGGVAAPVFSIPGGNYYSPISVKLKTSTIGASIYYTTDGSVPTTSSTLYSQAIAVSVSVTIRAIAVKSADSPSAVVSAVYVLPQPLTINILEGFKPGDVQLNGSAGLGGASYDQHVNLTGGKPNQAGSAFYPKPVEVDSFDTTFGFKIENPVADGFTFTIQNVAPSALGGKGAGLGYVNIKKSFAVKFDLYNNDGEGPNSTGVYAGGNLPTVPAIDLTGTGINLHSGHPFLAHITYDGTNLILTLTDSQNAAKWVKAFPVDIRAAIGGSTAYVGFTASTGGGTCIPEIQQWQYTQGPLQEPNYPLGFDNKGMLFNGSAAIAGITLELTNGGASQAGSAYYQTPTHVDAFSTSFDFQVLDPVADGFAYTIQNAGPDALGGKGAGLGFVTVPHSLAIKFDLYNNAGEGNNSIGLYIDGALPTVPSIDLTGSGVDLHSGHVIHVQIDYQDLAQSIQISLQDTTTQAFFNFGFGLPKIVPDIVGGASAYVGFTGSTGAGTSTQTIKSWTYGYPINLEDD